jgi:pentatricopeptide repeat protein
LAAAVYRPLQDDRGFTKFNPSLISKGLDISKASPSFHSMDINGSYSLNEATPSSTFSRLVSSKLSTTFVKSVLLEKMNQSDLEEIDLQQIVTILDSASISGNSKEAQSAFDYIGKCKLEASVDCYNLLIKAYTRANDLESAREVFGKMQVDTVVPNEDSYIYIFDAYVEAGDLDTASSLEKQWRTAGVLLPQRIYNILIQALVKRKNFRRVFP